MNYFLVRNWKTSELDHVYKTKGWIMGNCVEEITQVEFETYKEFGIQAVEQIDNGGSVRIYDSTSMPFGHLIRASRGETKR